MKSVKICHLYPELLNLYSDRGNMEVFRDRMAWRGMQAQVTGCTLEDKIDFSDTDILFLGGGSDREQRLVCENLLRCREDFAAFVADGGVVVAVCGGYQLLGRYYRMGDGTQVSGLSLLDIYTETGEGRLIGNVVIRADFRGQSFSVVGFENHAGRTYTGDYEPLGIVRSGYGNNGEDGREGVQYKNVFATYLHGPLLPKNPRLADEILLRALNRRYGMTELPPLDDSTEEEAHAFIVRRTCGGRLA